MSGDFVTKPKNFIFSEEFIDMRTETGYKIPDDVVDEIRYRIPRLSREQIDELYYKAGFIVKNAEEDGNKALTDKQLEGIKSGRESMIENLLRESREDTVRTIVDELSGMSEEDLE